MKNMLNYLWLKVVDLTLLLFFIAVLIRALTHDWWHISPYIIAANIFIIIYILGVAHRMSSAYEIMNQNIKDDAIRRSYGMNIYSMRNRKIKDTTLGLIFKIIFLAGAIMIIIFGIIL